MKEGLIALIDSKAALTNEIGSGDDMRLYPKVLPQKLKKRPAATYNIFNNIGSGTMDAASKKDFIYVDLQFYAKDEITAENLFNLFRSELERESGTYAGYVFTGIWYQPSGADDFLEDSEDHTKQLELKIGVKRQP
jgi:hypothetical protein